jgi:hypothetical protein
MSTLLFSKAATKLARLLALVEDNAIGGAVHIQQLSPYSTA